MPRPAPVPPVLAPVSAVEQEKAAKDEIARFPTLEAPDRVNEGQEFEVHVSLTEDQLVADVAVRPGPGASVDPSGRLHLPLPGDRKEWLIDVALFAPGFTFVSGPNFGQLRLPQCGDSTPASFRLRAEPVASSTPRARKLHATLTHEGRYLARITKDVAVGGREIADAAAPAVAEKPRSVQAAMAPISAGDAAAAPDLTVFILDAVEPDRLGQADVLVYSPWLQPATERIVQPAQVNDWIAVQYEKIIDTAVKAGPDRMKSRLVPLLNGIGSTLWDNFAPATVKQAFWKLRDERGSRFRTIQVFTNNPALPWELMRPSRPGGGSDAGFLGVDYAVARWHVANRAGQLERPPLRQPVGPLIAVAPHYDGADALPAQASELEALRSMPGFRNVPGRWAALAELFGRMPNGIIHFLGHGEVESGGGGVNEYRIRLEDALLDVTSWRGLLKARTGATPFFFFNACEVGQAQRVANFVDGWAPAVLEAGAAGYIGGLWPLADRSSAEFSTRFYRRVMDRVGKPDSTAQVAEILRENRRRFAETGDPTWIAYVLYGDVNLQFTRGSL